MDKPKIKLLLGFILVWLLAYLCSCSVERRAQKKTAWLLSKDLLDDICARQFPNHDSIVVKDSVRFDTLYVEGEEIIIQDTIYKKGDTILRILDKKCPRCPVLVKTVRKDSIIYRSNTSEIERLKGEILVKETQLKEKDNLINVIQGKVEKNRFWLIACLITWTLLVLYIVLRIKFKR